MSRKSSRRKMINWFLNTEQLIISTILLLMRYLFARFSKNFYEFLQRRKINLFELPPLASSRIWRKPNLSYISRNSNIWSVINNKRTWEEHIDCRFLKMATTKDKFQGWKNANGREKIYHINQKIAILTHFH